MVLLPLDNEGLDNCTEIVNLLRRLFDRQKMIFVSNQYPAGRIHRYTSGYRVFHPEVDQKGRHGLPDKVFVDRISQIGAKMALDLDASEDPYNPYLALKSGANIRIGIEKEIGEPFYNLRIRTDGEASLRHKYQDMLTFLTHYFYDNNNPKSKTSQPEV
ncbi:MAG: hypothetical protein GF315_12330 [candidate division Zixibacteria bacterium]|nr:hypothetical protein [candidate division Zixibacteria bacterium]